MKSHSRPLEYPSTRGLDPGRIAQLSMSTKFTFISTGQKSKRGVEQVLPVCTVANNDGRNGEVAVLQQAGWSYGINPRPFSKEQNPTKDTVFRATVAAKHDTSALTIGLPGASGWREDHLGLPKGVTTRLTSEQVEALREGDSGPIIEAMAQVAMQACDKYTLKRLLPIGSSLTTAIVPGMVQRFVEYGRNVAGLGIIEPVGLPDAQGRRPSRLSLAGAFGRSIPRGQDCLGQVHELFDEAPSPELTPSQLLLGVLGQVTLVRLLGVGAEPYSDDVIERFNETRAPIVVARGYATKFPDLDVRVGLLSERLKERGLDPDLFFECVYPVGHELSSSAAAYAAVIDQVLKTNGGQACDS